MLRCFVAVELSPEVREAVARAQTAVRAAAPTADVRWANPAGLHLTLEFLGGVEETRVPAVVEALAGAVEASAPLALVAAGLGGFPSARRPRVVWAGIAEGAEGLRRLAAAVEGALAPLGFPPEARPFSGHVTIGRVRSPRGLDRLAGAIAAAAEISFGSWTATDVVLYRSHLRRTGAVYEAMARLPMRAGSP